MTTNQQPIRSQEPFKELIEWLEDKAAALREEATYKMPEAGGKLKDEARKLSGWANMLSGGYS